MEYLMRTLIKSFFWAIVVGILISFLWVEVAGAQNNQSSYSPWALFGSEMRPKGAWSVGGSANPINWGYFTNLQAENGTTTNATTTSFANTGRADFTGGLFVNDIGSSADRGGTIYADTFNGNYYVINQGITDNDAIINVLENACTTLNVVFRRPAAVDGNLGFNCGTGFFDLNGGLTVSGNATSTRAITTDTGSLTGAAVAVGSQDEGLSTYSGNIALQANGSSVQYSGAALFPGTDNSKNLGSAANRWKDYFGSGTATTSALAVTGTATSTFAGPITIDGATRLATSLNGPLQANAGAVTATTSVGVLYGGTGAASFGQGWIYSNGGTSALAASTSPTVNYVTATSTTATSTFAGPLQVNGGTLTVRASDNRVGIGTINPTETLHSIGTSLFAGTAASSDDVNQFNTTASLTSGAIQNLVSTITLTNASASSASNIGIRSNFNTASQTNNITGGMYAYYSSLDTPPSGITNSLMTGQRIGLARTGAGTITSQIGLQISQDTANAGAVTTAYGVYMENLTLGSTNWQLYSMGGNSAFGGNTRFGGLTAPAVPLDVTGAGRISTTLQIGTAGTLFTGSSLQVEGGNVFVGTGGVNPPADTEMGRYAFFSTDSSTGARLEAGGMKMEYVNNYTGLNTTWDSRLKFDVLNNGATSTAMTILNTGLVGIGTTAPGHPLVVQGSGNQSIQINSTSNGSTLDDGLLLRSVSDSTGFLINRENAALQFGTDNSVDLTIATGGLIGIGDTTPVAALAITPTGDTVTNIATTFLAGTTTAISASANTYLYPFEFQYGAGTNKGRLQVAPYRRLDDTGSDWVGTGFRLQYAVDNSFTDGSRANIFLGTADDTTAGGGLISLSTGGSERLVVTSAGNVGIGTSTPTGSLEIRREDATANAFVVNRAGTNVFTMGVSNYNTNLSSANDFRFSSGSATDAVTIQDNTGYVGIGTTTPNAILSVTNATAPIINLGWGTSQFAELDFTFANRATNGFQIGTTGSYPVNLQTNGTNALTIDTSQRVGIGTTTPNSALNVWGIIRAKLGLATADVPVGGVVWSDVTAANTGAVTTEVTLLSKPVPALTLGTDGDWLDITVNLRIVVNDTDTVTTRFKWGGQTIYSLAYQPLNSEDQNELVKIRIKRLTAATQEITFQNVYGGVFSSFRVDGTQTLSSANNFVVTGQISAVDGTNNRIYYRESDARWNPDN